MQSEKITADASAAGERMDVFLSRFMPDRTRSFIQKMIADGAVSIHGKPVAKNYKLRGGETVEYVLPALRPLEISAESIPLDILYEDGDLLVVNKPRGMVVHPAAGNYEGTLVNALLAHCGNSLSGINGVQRPGIVHRIDKDTSGLLIVAKNDFAHAGLAEQIKNHSFYRAYEAVVHGKMKEAEGTVHAPIGRSQKDRKKMCVTSQHSKDAITNYTLLRQYRSFAHLRLVLETGRTHQIRVHMAYLGHPIAGDPVYGPKKGVSLNGQCLHARAIGFVHPRSGESLSFESALPDYFTDFLNILENEEKE